MRILVILTFLVSFGATKGVQGQDVDSLELLDPTDLDVLIEQEKETATKDFNISDLEEIDDLESLKEDVGDLIYEEEKDKLKKEDKVKKKVNTKPFADLEEDVEILIDAKGRVLNDPEVISEVEENKNKNPAKPEMKIFDVGAEEKELLELSKYVEGKIPLKEWDEIAASSQVDKYVIQKGDWLWKISQKLFGSGFYYSKIWSLNPQITNPHEIEPGMTLIFSTGDTEKMPEVNLGDFGDPESLSKRKKGKVVTDYIDFDDFGQDVKPPWINERKKLIREGIFFQFASEETLDDLKGIAKENLNSEYVAYEPPVPDIAIKEPGDQYDETGFDKNSKIIFDVKEGFFLNTFVTSNIVQDLGVIAGKADENIFINKFDNVYVEFDKSVKVKPGDYFSVYSPGGQVSNRVSDRAGYKYTISAQVKAVRKINRKWQCEVFDISGIVQRGDRLTVYTPKIDKIIKTFNKRNIEAAVVGSYYESGGGLSFGDVVYIDRGRADGVEMGNVFELYSFTDKGTGKRLTPDPTYKTGELTVISLSDNFSTALLSSTKETVSYGTLALTKTEEQASLDAMNKNKAILAGVNEIESNSLDELDIELSLDDISQDLLDKADQVKLTVDEIEEIERQEREKSIIKDHERDLKELERLENEILDAEQALNEAKVDEDKFLEGQDLNTIEKAKAGVDPNAFESLNEIESEVGLKFLDEDLNSKENPYGLTEFDLEEIDELLNTDEL